MEKSLVIGVYYAMSEGSSAIYTASEPALADNWL
jgi:hypothetical protein